MTDHIYQRHPDSHPNGGLHLKDEEGVVPKAFKEVLGKLAKKFASADF